MEFCNFKQIDLAKKSGICKSAINHYCKGYSIPRDEKMKLLAETLCVNENWLRGLNTPMKMRPQEMTAKEALELAGGNASTQEDVVLLEKYSDELDLMELTEQINNLTPGQRWDLLDRLDQIVTINQWDWKILELFNNLNIKGKSKVLEYAEDIGNILVYKKME